MRKTSLLNSNISSVISKMGHTDIIYRNKRDYKRY